MTTVNPVGGPIPPSLSPGKTVTGGQNSPDPKTYFGQMLENCIDKVDADQHVSTAAIQDLLSGKTQDVLPVVAAVAKADLSFKLLIGVRNKVIEAYKQTMNMQI